MHDLQRLAEEFSAKNENRAAAQLALEESTKKRTTHVLSTQLNEAQIEQERASRSKEVQDHQQQLAEKNKRIVELQEAISTLENHSKEAQEKPEELEQTIHEKRVLLESITAENAEAAEQLKETVVSMAQKKLRLRE